MRLLVKYAALIINIIFLVAYLMGCLVVYVNPSTFIGFVHFGTLFPILLVINIGFLLFWLITRKWLYSTVLLFIFICTFNAVRGVFLMPWDKANNSLEQSNISLLTYNISNFGGFKQIDPICNYIFEQNPDVVCLQEFAIRTENGKQDLDNIFPRFKEHYPYRMVWFKNQTGPRWWGVAIFSKYPLINKQKVEFESLYNVSVQADLIFHSDTIRLFNNHLESNKLTMNDVKHFKELQNGITRQELLSTTQLFGNKITSATRIRSGQANVLAHAIQQSPYPVIVCGDFNDVPQSYTYRHIRGNLRDALFEAGTWGYNYTFHSHGMLVRIDHVLIDQTFTPIASAVHRVSHSDHYPIMNYFKIPQQTLLQGKVQ